MFIFTRFSNNQLFWKKNVQTEVGQLLRNCLIFGQNLRKSQEILGNHCNAYSSFCKLVHIQWLQAYETSAKEKAVDTIEDNNKEEEITTETTTTETTQQQQQQQQQQQLEELQAQIEKLEETHTTLTESNKKLYHESDKKTTKIAKLEKTIRERDAVIAEKEAKEKEEAENSIQSHRDRKLHIEGLKEEIVQLVGLLWLLLLLISNFTKYKDLFFRVR